MSALDYTVFGLQVRSSLPLPELFPAPDCNAPDVTIELGSVPTPDNAGPGINAANGALVLVIPDIGRFSISGGNSIIIDAEPGTPERNIRLYLLGSAFGALLHQRGLLPLHANALDVGGKAVAFMGASGAGKSTLAAWLHKHGHRMIADDVCVVGFDDSGLPYASPGLPRLRLWAEALELMGREREGLARSYVGDEEYDKFDLPIGPESAAFGETPLAAVYVLERGQEFSIEPLAGVDAAEAVFAHTYRGAYIHSVSGQRGHWAACIRLIRSIDVFRVKRVWGLEDIDRQVELILDHVRPMVSNGS
jgi:hypothetical protein